MHHDQRRAWRIPFSLRKSRVASFQVSLARKPRTASLQSLDLDQDVFNVRQRERRRDRYFCLCFLAVVSYRLSNKQIPSTRVSFRSLTSYLLNLRIPMAPSDFSSGKPATMTFTVLMEQMRSMLPSMYITPSLCSNISALVARRRACRVSLSGLQLLPPS